MKLALSAFVSFSFFLAACSIGTRYDLTHAVPPLALDSPFEITVVVRDRRPEVVAGRRPPEWIGRQLRGPDRPEEVVTASGRALARDLSEALVGALRASGLRAKPQDALQLRLGARDGQGRTLRLTLRVLQSESFVNVLLIYDLQAEVLDSAGAALGRSERQGEALIGGDIVYPLGHGGELVPEALGRVLAGLLQDSAIRSALK